jgi:hypothetical protein
LGRVLVITDLPNDTTLVEYEYAATIRGRDGGQP